MRSPSRTTLDHRRTTRVTATSSASSPDTTRTDVCHPDGVDASTRRRFGAPSKITVLLAGTSPMTPSPTCGRHLSRQSFGNWSVNPAITVGLAGIVMPSPVHVSHTSEAPPRPTGVPSGVAMTATSLNVWLMAACVGRIVRVPTQVLPAAAWQSMTSGATASDAAALPAVRQRSTPGYPRQPLRTAVRTARSPRARRRHQEGSTGRWPRDRSAMR
jgi:hypothetical protein